MAELNTKDIKAEIDKLNTQLKQLEATLAELNKLREVTASGILRIKGGIEVLERLNSGKEDK